MTVASCAPMSSPSKALALCLFMSLLSGCGSSEDQCRRRPAAEDAYGQCEAIIGVYFDVYRAACISVSGCECDASCRAEELPFTDVASCEDACADTAI